MKTSKKILLAICVIIIAVGMFIVGRMGFNYVEGYTEGMLLDIVKSYLFYVGLATLIILVYLGIRYNKQGVLKILITSVLGIVGAIALAVAVIAITRMPVNRIFFPIILTAYASSIIILTAYFEQNVK